MKTTGTKSTVWRSGQTGFVVKDDATGKVVWGPGNKVGAFKFKKSYDAS